MIKKSFINQQLWTRSTYNESLFTCFAEILWDMQSKHEWNLVSGIYSQDLNKILLNFYLHILN
jgi:hypothetical protein